MKNVRVLKDALLDRLCVLNDDGTYYSDYKKNKRFAITLLTLSGGRVAISKASNVILFLIIRLVLFPSSNKYSIEICICKKIIFHFIKVSRKRIIFDRLLASLIQANSKVCKRNCNEICY